VAPLKEATQRRSAKGGPIESALTFRTRCSVFGWTVGGALVALAGLFWCGIFGRHDLARDILAASGTALIVLGTVYPVSLREVRAGWLAAAHGLGWLNTRILLGLFYYSVVSPVGLVMRLFGRDPLDRKWLPNQPSYWIRRDEQRPPDHFEHQF